MLILLPPSQGQAAARAGRPLETAALSLPELTPARERVLDALVELCARDDPGPARTVLGLSPGQDAQVRGNADLRRAATLPAGRLYTGVLYEALDLAGLSAPARRLVRRCTLVFSGLWGAVRLTDRIPPYRCAMDVRLPGVGGLGGYWRRALAGPVAEAAGGGPVLDLRSSAYAAAWSPPRELAGRSVAVRVLHERTVDGVTRRTVVSHFNKATKGRLVRALAEAGARPRSVAELVTALRDLQYTVEQPGPGRLDVVVPEL